MNENVCLQELFADEVFAEICFGTFQAALTVEDLALENQHWFRILELKSSYLVRGRSNLYTRMHVAGYL